MSELKNAQKKLNKNMKENSGKGKGAKQLMKLAKQQEDIRQQLMELRDEVGKNGEKGKIDKIIEEMEKNEEDIVNNRITNETLKRQKDILTKLLQAENALREEEEEEKERQSIEWEQENNTKSIEYIEYIKQKKAHDELLKTTPVNLKPYYKEKTKIYFNSLIKEQL